MNKTEYDLNVDIEELQILPNGIVLSDSATLKVNTIIVRIPQSNGTDELASISDLVKAYKQRVCI